jgi:hypothetical protein
LQAAALVAGAGYLTNAAASGYVLSLADDWNARIEEWSYVEGSQLDQVFGLAAHDVRVGPDPMTGPARIANQADTGLRVRSAGVLGLEFMYLARLGLRDPSDQRLIDSTRLVDIMLGRDVGTCVGYYRNNYDAYGEQVDGGQLDRGGCRPGLAVAGRRARALRGPRRTGRAQPAHRHPCHALPVRPVARTGLQPPLVPRAGVPSMPLNIGSRTLSAMPLVWAHGELIQMAFLRASRVPIEQAASVTARYGGKIPVPGTAYWRPSVPLVQLPPNTDLVVEDTTPFTLHYGHDNWTDVSDLASAPLGLGMLGETAGQGVDAEPCLGGHAGQVEAVGGVLVEPGQQRGQRGAVRDGRGWAMNWAWPPSRSRASRTAGRCRPRRRIRGRGGSCVGTGRGRPRPRRRLRRAARGSRHGHQSTAAGAHPGHAAATPGGPGVDRPGAVVATVCGGSLALAMAGLLEGRHVVTHHLGMSVLEATGAIAVPARLVEDGNLVSAAGVHLGPGPGPVPARTPPRAPGRARGRGDVRVTSGAEPSGGPPASGRPPQP